MVGTEDKFEEKEVALQFQMLLKTCRVVEMGKGMKEGLVVPSCIEKLEVLGVET